MAKGWKFESWRHALSAKGVKTSKHKPKPMSRKKGKVGPFMSYDASGRLKFFAEKEEGGGMFKETRFVDLDKDLRRRDISEKQEEVTEKLTDAVKEGKLTSENRERFLKEDFKNESEFLMNNAQNMEDFDRNVDRKLTSFMQIHSRTLGPIIPEREPRPLPSPTGQPPALAEPEKPKTWGPIGGLTKGERRNLAYIRGQRKSRFGR